jgi:hypothetical protein
MRARRSIVSLTAMAVTTVVGVALAPTASAHSGPPRLHVVKTISSSYIGPLQFAVADPHTIVVADSFTSTLNLVGRAKPLATGPDPSTGGDIAGVAVRDHSALAYTSSNGSHTTTTLTILSKGHKVVADLSGFEKKYNPDQRIHYGTTSTDPCVTNALTAAGIPVQYTGQLDSHPYAVTALPGGAWAVADAGGNDILKVDRWGHVSLIAVLPPQALHVTAEFAAESGLPACVVGVTYNFEAVPTDVEVGLHGALYATTLPGGEGVAGSVYKVGWHHATRIATGFQGATNLAIDRHGNIFVAELMGGYVSEIVRGKPVHVLALPAVVGLEYANGHLYASTAPAALLDDPDSGAPAPTGPPPPGAILLLS